MLRLLLLFLPTSVRTGRIEWSDESESEGNPVKRSLIGISLSLSLSLSR
jgi:hypothetical protein